MRNDIFTATYSPGSVPPESSDDVLEVRAEAVEEPRHLEEDREIGEPSRGRDLGSRIPFHVQPPSVGGDVELRVPCDLEPGHFTPDGCCGTIHCVAPPFGFGLFSLKVYTKAGATFRIRETR